MLAGIRDRLVARIGKRAAHAIEDGLTIGIIAGLLVTFPPLGVVLFSILSGHPRKKGPLAMIAELPDLVRGDDARAQESWLTGATVLGALIGVVVGGVVAFAALSVGVSVPIEGIVSLG